jgi:hypothetical protein
MTEETALYSSHEFSNMVPHDDDDGGTGTQT